MKFMRHRRQPVRGRRLAAQTLAFGIVVITSLVAAHLMAEVAGQGCVEGRITDAQTGKPLGFANIVVVGTKLGAMSRDDGCFRIDCVPAGQQIIRAMMMGYETVNDTIDVLPDSTVQVDFTTNTTIVAVTDEIMVEATRKKVDVSSSDVRSGKAADSSVQVKREAQTGDQLHARGGRPSEHQVRQMERPAPLAVPETSSQGYTVRGARTTKPPTEHLVDRAPVRNEGYAPISESGFQETIDNPYSTFAVDVDAASYSNVRRFIRTGQLPPRDAVRVEEMINYFAYDYPDPEGDDPFSISIESAHCPWNGENELVRVGLQGRHIDLSEAPPSNLVFLLDVSGSMQPPNKLPLLRRAFVTLVDNLRDKDRIAIVTFANCARVRLPSTSGRKRDTITAAIEKLNAQGSTAGGAGLELAYNIATENLIDDGNNRVILATDGDFNVGLSANSDMVRLIEKRREQGVYLTVLGFGEANIKDDKLEMIADHGNGHYAYIDDIFEARKVLVNELGTTLFTIAKDVKVQVEFNPAKVEAYRLVGYENRLLADEDFTDDRKDGGEIGAGHSVTALYEVVPSKRRSRIVRKRTYTQVQIAEAAFESPEMLTVRFRYKGPDEDESREIERVFEPTKTRFRDASPDFRFATAVAEFGMLLRSSTHKGEASYRHVVDTAHASLGEDDGGYRHEFVRLAEMCRDLAGEQKD